MKKVDKLLVRAFVCSLFLILSVQQTWAQGQFAVTAVSSPPTCPEISPGYVPNGTINVTIIDADTCVGLYDIVVTPTVNSSPLGNTPPFTTPNVVFNATDAGSPYLFTGAGSGQYIIQVFELGLCNAPTNPVVLVATVPDANETQDPIWQIADVIGNTIVDNNIFTLPGTTGNFGTTTIPDGSCSYQEQLYASGFDLCDGFITNPSAVSLVSVSTVPVITPNTQVSVIPDGFGTFLIDINWSIGTSTVVLQMTDASGNAPLLTLIRTVNDNIEPTIAASSEHYTIPLCDTEISPIFGFTISDGCGEFIDDANLVVSIDGFPGATATRYFPVIGTQNGYVEYTLESLTEGSGSLNISYTDAFGNSTIVHPSIVVNQTQPEPFNIACHNGVNVTLNDQCSFTLTPEIVVSGSIACLTAEDFEIVVLDGNPDNGPVIDGVGEFIVEVNVPSEDYFCWGTVNAEDKRPPEIECVNVTVNCGVPTEPSDVVPPAVATDNCVDVYLDHTDTEIGELCEGLEIERLWVAVDGSGNTASCLQTITILPLEIDEIECPENFVGECTDSLDPDDTGWPTIDGTDLTSSNPICNLFVEYWDKPLTDCGGGKKIIRTFTILDWCTQGVRECVQIIKLSDNEGPEMTCPDDMIVGTDFWYCYANVSIPKPTVFDACGSEYTLSLGASAGIVTNIGNNYVINELPLGVTTVTWTAIDDCDNESTCSFTITVEDDVPPVPNCDEHTIVSLTNDAPYGTTLVSASVFDDGSYDNCSDLTFEARRMATCIDYDWTTAGACIDDVPNGDFSGLTDGGMGFKPCVPFACCDVAQGPIMVELKVTDAAGNENFCMVEIEVQDKLAPYIECPPNIIVSCDFWFDSDVVTGQRIPLDQDPMTAVFGTVIDAYEVHDDQSARQHIIINDPGNDQEAQPKDWGIDGWSDDNCDVTLDVKITIEDDCSGDDLPSGAPDHAVRYIERRFTATDGQDNSDNCRQIIWVLDFDPFYIADEDCNNGDRNDGVEWPCDELYTTCPDEIGVNEPVIYDDNCSLVAVTYEDTRFDFVDGACYKILREWKVIDWCQYTPSGAGGTGTGYWTYTQVIKVIDSDGPAFTDCPAGPVTLCAADEGVSLPDNNQVFLGEGDPDHSYCSVHLEGSLTVEEFCSDYVIYDVKVYPFNGANYYQLVSKTQVDTDENGQAELPYNTATSTIPAIKANGLPYNSPFCGDYHRVLWSVEDGCGNISTCEYLLRLEDCKQPTPVCVNGLSTVVMPVGGTVTIWASEYDVSSIDDCTHSEDLLFSFSGDDYQPSRVWNCDNVAVFGAELSVEVWVADDGVDHNCDGQITWNERNKDFCTTTIVITDNDGVCPNSGNVIAGEVMTHEDLEPVGQTTINLSHPTNVFPSMVTVEDGQYAFTNVPAEGPYTVTPNRNDDHKNGVSTLDLVRIQKHLLGVEPFTSAYQYIAADANNTEGVSAIDLVEIRKLILGIYNEFPNNSSWRFVDSKYAFDDVTSPWPFNESITMDHLGSLNIEEDFMAVKVGDLNNTVVANSNQVVTRSGREEMLATANAKTEVQAGETFEVEVSIPSEILGFQWTLDLNGLNYIGIESDHIGADNVGVHEGQITMSYARTSGDDAVTFKLIFEATKEGRSSDMIHVTSDITEMEGYVLVPAASAADNEIEIVDLNLDFGLQSVVEEYALYQNEPNPFIDQTIIGFDLPSAMTATLTVYEATGKVVRTIEGDFATGYNTVSLSRNDLSAGGVYYYHLTAGEFTASKKMIVTK